MTLEIRRKRADLMECYKILNGLNEVEWINVLVKTDQGNNDGPASRLMVKKGCIFTGSQPI